MKFLARSGIMILTHIYTLHLTYHDCHFHPHKLWFLVAINPKSHNHQEPFITESQNIDPSFVVLFRSPYWMTYGVHKKAWSRLTPLWNCCFEKPSTDLKPWPNSTWRPLLIELTLAGQRCVYTGTSDGISNSFEALVIINTMGRVIWVMVE